MKNEKAGITTKARRAPGSFNRGRLGASLEPGAWPLDVLSSNHLKPFTGYYSHLQTPLPPVGIFWPAKSKILMLPHFSCHAQSRQITPCHALSRVFQEKKDCLFFYGHPK
jgi:hypothetical protein